MQMGRKVGLAQDVDRLAGHDLDVEIDIAIHKILRVVDLDLRLPDADARAIALGKGQRVREDEIEASDGLDGKAGGPVEPFGLHAFVNGRTCQALDVALERRVVVEGLAAAAMLDDAERDAAHVRDLERPL